MSLVKIVNDDSIIEYSALIIRSGMQPNRVVLRKLSNNEYVTHRENLTLQNNEFVHKDFYLGHYFQSYDDALEDFRDREQKMNSF